MPFTLSLIIQLWRTPRFLVWQVLYNFIKYTESQKPRYYSIVCPGPPKCVTYTSKKKTAALPYQYQPQQLLQHDNQIVAKTNSEQDPHKQQQ